MLKKRTRQITALLCTVILLSSQYAVASYVCPKMSPMDMSLATMSAECMHEMEAAASPLCKAHCDQTPQANEVPSITFAPFMVQTHWTLVYLDLLESPSSLVHGSGHIWLTEGSPPLRIQFQVFRI